jgi:methylphosphotriester-DNA--protein-cysteine methyltransferase
MRHLHHIYIVVLLFACAYTSVEAQTVYITKTGAKYHLSTCHYLKSKIKISLPEAEKQGYTPCSYCKPSKTLQHNNNKQVIKSDSTALEQKKTSSSQCQGTTQAGTRCKRMTTHSSGYCYQHQ